MTTGVALSLIHVVLAAIPCVQPPPPEKYPVKQLTNDPVQEGFPCWSPDGKTIVFSRIEVPTTEKTGLWRIPREGGTATRLTNILAEHPSYSPDGAYIVFDADEGKSVKLISATGGTPIRIVPESIPVYQGSNPLWSPDSARIAFHEGWNLWVLELSTGQLTKVFAEENIVPLTTCWSRDAQTIYVVKAVRPQPWTLWTFSADWKPKQQLTFEKDGLARYADLSPDGALLVFTLCEGRACDLWVMPAGGGKRIQLTTDPAYDDTPRWSPDGKAIAFTSTRSGNFDIWLMEVDAAALLKELESLK
ncbi:MAG TPA: hypothetical protein PKK06_00765 [Phycisphaerae bacterium]|nr:hypothetical protein [Phycisphaerae bacterium]HNU43860.1 hypothetical protein [Phycisphaerae bacterium]